MGNYATVQAAPVAPLSATAEVEPDPRPPLPDGYVRVERIDSSPTKNPSVTKYFITLSTGEGRDDDQHLARVRRPRLARDRHAGARGHEIDEVGRRPGRAEDGDGPAEPPLPTDRRRDSVLTGGRMSAKPLHRGLAVTRRNNAVPSPIERPLSDAEQQAVLEHDVAKLQQPKSLLDMALDHIGRTRLELEAQLDEAAESCRQLRQEIAWLDQQRDSAWACQSPIAGR